ncbi:helicase-like transcription factor CHR28 isoform X2 [Ricinus communis]|uniref:helicase-like transcription factor CHR28 isoform X2 n=1 Tax=Ricinus communis TaxID=3988 RepID=UPI00201AEF56|nr:helicase-like transcription factor CHR28 isoform X2 [Ricinus communis]
MMLMADGGGSGDWPGGEILDVDELDGGGEGGDDLSMDFDLFFNILSEPVDPSQSSHEDFSCKNAKVESATDVGNQKNCQLPSGSHTMAFNDVNLEPSSQISCHMHACSGSFKEWISPVSSQGDKRDGLLQSGIPSCSTSSSFADGESNHVSDITGNLDFNILFGETGTQFRYAGGNTDSKDASRDFYTDSLDGKFAHGYALTENSSRSSGSENDFFRHADTPFEDTDVSLHNLATTKSTFCHNSDVHAHHSAVQFGINSDNTYFIDSPPCFDGDFSFELLSSNEIGEFQTESACSASEPMIDYSDDKGLNFKNEGFNCMSPISANFSSNTDDRIIDDKSLAMPLSCIQSAISKKPLVPTEDKKAAEVIACSRMMCHSDEMINEVVNRKISCIDESSRFVEEELKQSSSIPSHKNFVYMKDEKGDMNSTSMRSQVSEIAKKFPFDRTHLNSNASGYYLSCAEKSNVNKQSSCIKQEIDSKLIRPKCLRHLSSVSHESIQSNLHGNKSHIDDDSDICILEDISQPARSHQSLAFGKAHIPLQHSAYGDFSHYTGVATARPKANDERFIFQAALQDLSQPKSEATLPEGVLAVPLMRHQRIALSWMVQKETSSLYCSGGILADDQGLGKTVSTIALILKERPPSVKADLKIVKKEELETLNLDEDDDEVSEVGQRKEDAESCQVKSNLGPGNGINTFGQSKGRPAAGTLIVCPTSVLRQWAEELHKKVTSEANLSVLVYHGSNRTKDPFLLAKYDVVLTTYSIVSMEVPKQPLVGEDDDEKVKVEGDDVASLGLSSSKKRKYPPTSGKKGSRNKKGMEAALLESAARPLAKVAWFRVVLDEAQSIKNHRTQVARACWGLRAKRRWCLSGTPIQNAIDDLYSYFRFLRYDPYAVYNSFCSTIKIPIQKSPTKGYKKLQAVLKTIMLRRTKGTHIDGKPIINLPPKVVELKKVDFTDEERDFYTQLENDSRAQFREYAAAGTVKQNYVNILLMLLRLRQACDHPLLVRGIDSNLFGRSSMEMAKKLPREKQICLLNCLEASLAICGICNDPPEDAVVSICGHVFCNQCICEHMTGDDNQCPTSKCKVRLNTSSVFSKATLNSSLSGQLAQDGSGSELGGAANPYSQGLPYDSSKIRAALDVLKSLNKPKDCRSTNDSLEKSLDGSVTCSENLCTTGNSVNDNTDKKNILVDDNVNGSVKVGSEKAIVFSQWTRMLDLLEACLKSSSVQYRRLDGTMSVVARDKAVKDFNTIPEVSVMIMSLKAASLGLNMVAACRVLLLDLWWNPTTEDQAIDRAHRIGQTRPVTVFRLTVKDTVEDRILALQQKKREMVASAFGEDETGGRQTRLTVEDLKYLFMV